MGIKLGLDVGTEFITASLLNGDQRQNAFRGQVGDKIPAIIVAYRDNDQWKFKYGKEAVDAMKSDQNEINRGNSQIYYAIDKPLKSYLRGGGENLFIDCEGKIGATKVGTVKDIASDFFKTIFREIKAGLEEQKLSESIEVIAVGYPNDRTAKSANYYNELINYIKQAYQDVFRGSVIPTVLVYAEAYYVAKLLRSMDILSENEIALIVDIGAGTTDFAFVKTGDAYNIEGSYDFGGYNVDTILYKEFGVRKEIAPDVKIGYKYWFLNKRGLNIPNVGIRERKRVYNDTIISSGSNYQITLNSLASAIYNKAKLDQLQSGFKIILTGGSCLLPYVQDVISSKFLGYSPTFIIMDQYKKRGEEKTEAEKICIDNETFMSYAAALVAESYVDCTTGAAIGEVDEINVWGFGIIAVSTINKNGDKYFYKLIEAEPGEEPITVLVKGQFYTRDSSGGREDVFKGVGEDIYFLHEVERCDGQSKGPDRYGHETKVRNTQCKDEFGIIYETTYISGSRYEGLKGYIEMAFTPKCNGGKALVLDNNGREITSQPDNKTHNYNVEVTYNYGAFVSNDERIQVKYIQVP